MFRLGHVLLALTCMGMRISEFASLRWSDVDFESNSITLADKTRRGTFEVVVRCKSAKQRTATGRPFRSTPELRRFLKRWMGEATGIYFMDRGMES